MLSKFRIIILAIALLGFGMLQNASAARSLTKSYQVSVVLPAAISSPNNYAPENKNLSSRIASRQITQEMIITRDNKRYILRSTVIQ